MPLCRAACGQIWRGGGGGVGAALLLAGDPPLLHRALLTYAATPPTAPPQATGNPRRKRTTPPAGFLPGGSAPGHGPLGWAVGFRHRPAGRPPLPGRDGTAAESHRRRLALFLHCQ